MIFSSEKIGGEKKERRNVAELSGAPVKCSARLRLEPIPGRESALESRDAAEIHAGLPRHVSEIGGTH